MKKTFATALALVSAVSASAYTLVNTSVTTNTTWGNATNSSPIILDGPIYVKSGAVLTILPGTVIRGQPRRSAGDGAGAAPGSLVVTRDGFVNANGNAGNPIIFTTAAVDNITQDSAGNQTSATPDGIPDYETAATPAFLVGTTGSGDNFYDATPKTSPLSPRASGAIVGSTAASGTDANCELWGGLIILGSAPTNLDDSATGVAREGQIEGLTASADSTYGGDIPNDNSGIFRYISVRHGGEEIGSGNEINGITLGGVGYGTTFEYIDVAMNWDDGIECFGGTVNMRYLSIAFAGDDQLDGDQGWTGQNQFIFAVLPYFNIGTENGDEGLEFDGDDGSVVNLDLSGNVNPLSGYTAYNLTIVGPSGASNRTNGDNGNGRITLKANYSGQIVNSIVVNTGNTAGVSNSTGNPVLFESCTFDDVDNTSSATSNELAEANVTANNVVVNSITFNGLEGEDQSVALGLDPRPALAFSGVTTSVTVPNGYTQVSYRGAFDPDAPAGTLWIADWTYLSLLGVTVD